MPSMAIFSAKRLSSVPSNPLPKREYTILEFLKAGSSAYFDLM